MDRDICTKESQKLKGNKFSLLRGCVCVSELFYERAPWTPQGGWSLSRCTEASARAPRAVLNISVIQGMQEPAMMIFVQIITSIVNYCLAGQCC